MAKAMRSATSTSDDESDAQSGMEDKLSDACHGFEERFDCSSDAIKDLFAMCSYSSLLVTRSSSFLIVPH